MPYKQSVQDLRAENARLRAALVAYVDFYPYGFWCEHEKNWPQYNSRCKRCIWERAMAALEESVLEG